MTTPKALWTAEQLFELADDGRKSELLDGELVEVTPPGGEHSGVAAEIIFHLRGYLGAGNLPYLVGSEAGVVLARNPDRVRAPDVYLIRRDRLPGGKRPTSYLESVPDLIVEVVSPNDRALEIQDKVEEWLRGGAQLVWVAYPRSRTVYAHRGLDDVQVYRPGDHLDAEPVLPSFSVAVEDLFA